MITIKQTCIQFAALKYDCHSIPTPTKKELGHQMLGLTS